MNVSQTKDVVGLPITRIETIANAVIDLTRVGYAGLEEKDAVNYLLEEGEILFSHINSVPHIGKCALYFKEFGKLIHGMNLLSFKPDPKLVIPKYALYALRSDEFKTQLSKSIKKSVNQASVSIGDIKKIKLNVPPLAKQKRIAAILDKADEIKRKREQAIAKLDQLAQSIFVEMFGDLANNSKGWECALLANVCERAGEYGAGVASIPYSNSLPIYVRITDIDDNGDLTKKPVSPAGNQKDWCNYKLEVGDVLFARSGATVGKTYLHKNTEGYYVFAGYLIRFRPIVSLVNPQFLFHFTKTDFYNAWVIARQRVVAQPNINAKQYGYDLLIPVPPIALQEQFATRISKLEKLKASNIAALEKHNELFASLQSQAFTGQL